MKHNHLKECLLLVLLAGFLAPCLQAQSDTTQTKSDTTEVSWEKKKFVITAGEGGSTAIVNDDADQSDSDNWYDDDGSYYEYVENYKRRRQGFTKVNFISVDAGMLYYLHDGNITTRSPEPRLEVSSFRPYSHWAVHILPTRIGLFGQGVVSLRAALSFDFNFFHYQNDITLEPDQPTLTIVDANENLRSSRLFISYFQIPVSLYFNTRPGSNKGLQFQVGAFYGWRMGTSTKVRDANKSKLKVKDRFNTYPFHYGITASIRFRWIEIYGNFNLSPVFYEDQANFRTGTFTTGLRLFTL